MVQPALLHNFQGCAGKLGKGKVRKVSSGCITCEDHWQGEQVKWALAMPCLLNKSLLASSDSPSGAGEYLRICTLAISRLQNAGSDTLLDTLTKPRRNALFFFFFF